MFLFSATFSGFKYPLIKYYAQVHFQACPKINDSPWPAIFQPLPFYHTELFICIEKNIDIFKRFQYIVFRPHEQVILILISKYSEGEKLKDFPLQLTLKW